MIKFRFSILYRILLAFSVLIIGYFITIFLIGSTRRGIEDRLKNISLVIFPVEKLSISAEINFDNLVKSYSDGVLMGELKLIKDAEDYYSLITGNLLKIAMTEEIPDSIKESVQEVILILYAFFEEASMTYGRLASGELDQDILDSAKNLSDQKEVISKKLNYISAMLSSYLAGELKIISQEMADIQYINRAIFYSVLVISLFVGIIVIRIIVLRPIKRILLSSDQIAGGNLKIDIPVRSNDELGDLGKRFNEMAKQLYNTVLSIHSSYIKMTASNNELDDRVHNVVKVINKQGMNLKHISDYLSDVITSIQEISGNIKDLFKNADDTSSSVIKMTDSISKMLQNIEILDNITIQTASSSEKLALNIKRTSINANQLNQLAENISASMIEMEQSTRQIETISKESMNLAEEVSDNSKDSMDIVNKNIKLMNIIRDAVHTAVTDIEGLKSGSKEIGNILLVINDITEQTNLLSLNAAIIAAHAGEYGKSFSVVAEEIRNLSEGTKSSTREIEDLIKDFQGGINKSVNSMRKTADLIEEGAKHSQETGGALERIYRSAQKSSSISKEIVRNTKEQTESSRLITKDVYEETSMIKEINTVLEELAVISEDISKAAQGIKNSSKESRISMVYQSEESKQISKAVNNFTEMIYSINKASQEQNNKSNEINRIIELLKEDMEENLQSIKHMTDALAGLKRESASLNDAISKFKIQY